MRKILVVDDEEKIRAIIRKYGEFEGYSIAEAKDGMEAVKLCREQDFDVVILDVSSFSPEVQALPGFPLCGSKPPRDFFIVPVNLSFSVM